MIEKKNIFSISIFFILIVLICCFKETPSTQIWKGYKTVYVKSSELSLNSIHSIFKENGCSSIIYRENQKIPFSSSMAPIQVQAKDSYIVRRNDFFTDYSKEFEIFYIPDNQKKQIESSLKQINGFTNTSAFVDGSSSFPVIIPVLSLIFAALLFYFSKNKILFLLNALPFIFLIFARPFFTIAAASFLSLTGFFFLQKNFERRGFFTEKKSILIFSLLNFFPVLFLIFSSFSNALFYIFALISSFCPFIFSENVKKILSKKLFPSKFEFSFIKSAASVNIINKKSLKIFVLVSFFILILIPVLNFSTVENVSSSNEKTLLPSPKDKISSKDFALVNFDDLINWAWSTVTFPYRKLGSVQNEKVQKGQKIVIPEYKEINGKIEPVEKEVLTFDSSFVEQICDTIQTLEYPAVEKMILQQGKNSLFAYCESGGTVSEKNGNFILAVFFFIPILFILFYFFRKIIK